MQRLAAIVCASSLIACGAGSSKGSGGGDLNDAGFVLDSGSGSNGDGSPGDDVGIITPTDAISTTTNAAVYGHSPTTLYKLDPDSLAVTTLGDFSDTNGNAITDMTDIALDKDGVMYGVSYVEVYRIDYKSGAPKCTPLASLDTEFNGLTFIPAGMIDPANEVLIGVALDGGWWRVDVAAGSTKAKLTQLGSYGGGWGSSGDAVGIIGDAVYATVTNGSGADHVVTVDPKTGKVLKDIGSTGVSKLWGVGYWGGVMYGFDDDGSLYKIDLKTAVVTSVPIANPPDEWWGAGVTTSAPVIVK